MATIENIYIQNNLIEFIISTLRNLVYYAMVI